LNRSIYLLSPRRLSPETIAVAFAKTSRSPESFQAIADELSDESSAQFHEKWVVGYGHSSVAEHAVLHVAFENVSRLAIESIESSRLASYTEKSTRYQKWDPGGFYTPRALAESRHAALYRQTCEALFQAYHDSLESVRKLAQARHPRREGESDARWEGRIRSKYVDVCRYFLPTAALANVGMTANARVLENAIRKMLSHPLDEVREIGAEVKRVALAETPTLVKYADPVAYISDTERALRRWAGASQARPAPAAGEGRSVELVAYEPEAEERFLAACLYRFEQVSFTQARQQVRGLSAEQRTALTDDALARLGRHDAPLREVEHVAYTFDTIMDQGAYFEIKRHRMMTQTPQRLTARLGYAVPRAIDEAGVRGLYDVSMQSALAAYAAMAADFPEEAAYVVPNAFNRRLLMTLNLRELFHFCELRTAPNAHFSVRRIAGQMHEQAARAHPALARFMRLGDFPGWRAIEAEYFSRV
jgi:thymidylate synthase ThyX